MSKRSSREKTASKTATHRGERRAQSGRYTVRKGETFPRTSHEPREPRDRQRRDAVRRAAKIVVRLHRGALKELEKH